VRHDDDLYCQLEVSMGLAAVGRTVMVDTRIDGPAEWELPAGAQPGDMLRLKGKGMPRLRRGGRGDLVVQLLVRTPTRLNKRQRELLEEMAELGDREAAPIPNDQDAGHEVGARRKKKRRWGL
jgi:molecular chaperone DnaJ